MLKIAPTIGHSFSKFNEMKQLLRGDVEMAKLTKGIFMLILIVALSACGNRNQNSLNEPNTSISEAASEHVEKRQADGLSFATQPPEIGIVYTNQRLGFSLTLPSSWEGKYVVVENEESIDFFHNLSMETTGSAGLLFFIWHVDELLEGHLGGAGERHLVAQTQSSYYIFGTASSVEYSDESEAEYKKMYADFPEIRRTFETITPDLGTEAQESRTPKLEIIVENIPADNADMAWERYGVVMFDRDGKRGAMNSDGEILIPFERSSLDPSGRFIFRRTYDTDGEYVITPFVELFDLAGNMVMNREAFAKAMLGGYEPNSATVPGLVSLFSEDSYKFVDFTGETFVPLTDLLSSFWLGEVYYDVFGELILIRDENWVGYGVDLDANIVLQREEGFSYVGFSDGMTLRVKLDPDFSDENRMVTPVAFYDLLGNHVFDVPETAMVALSLNTVVILDYAHLDTMLTFSEGLAAFRDRDTGLVGFLDKTGEVVIPAQFESCEFVFTKGVAGVKRPGSDLVSIIDTSGYEMFVVPWKGIDVWEISNGFFGAQFFLWLDESNQSNEADNKSMNIVWDMEGNQVFQHITVRESDGTRFYHVFGSGEPESSEFYMYANVALGFVVAWNGIIYLPESRVGLFSFDGVEILPSVYENIVMINDSPDNRFILYKDGMMSIVRLVEDEPELIGEEGATGDPTFNMVAAIDPEIGIIDDSIYTFPDGTMRLSPGEWLLMVNGRFTTWQVVNRDNHTFISKEAAISVFGEEVTANGKEIMHDGEIFLPLRFLSEYYGKAIGYFPASRALTQQDIEDFATRYPDWKPAFGISEHAVVWIDCPIKTENAKQTDALLDWLQGELRKNLEILKEHHGTLFGGTSLSDYYYEILTNHIEKTRYIGNAGRYAIFFSPFVFLVDAEEKLIYMRTGQLNNSVMTKANMYPRFPV